MLFDAKLIYYELYMNGWGYVYAIFYEECQLKYLYIIICYLYVVVKFL